MRKITRNTDIYAIRDRIVKVYLRIILRKFKKISQRTITDFDDLNVLDGVSTAFNEIVDISVEALKEVAKKTAEWLTDGDEDLMIDMWFTGWLNEVNPITLYRWSDEAERKKSRFIETLIGSKTSAQRKKQTEIATKYWVRQFEQYADDVVTEVLTRAEKKANVKYVMWVTYRDARVCPECHARDGKIYPITSPQLKKLHYNCRCYWISAK